MKTSKPFTMSYALIPSAMLLTSVGLLNFDDNNMIGYGCLVISAILIVVSLIQIIRDKVKESKHRFT